MQHLLGKKSWNVYNADNIARVRRDEAAAKAAEEAEEQRMQEVDAERRLAILRGEEPPPLRETAEAEADRQVVRRSRDDFSGSGRRQRKKQGEDDTDFELRLARERQGGGSIERATTSSAPIIDHAGHIDLFGNEKERQHSEKNDEVERQKKKKERDFEDQYTMRFSNAAGRNASGKPWYSTSSSEVATVTAKPPSKDVWGNDDPKRQERETKRAAASDPLAMMRSGAAKVRELKKERKKAREEREAELNDLKKEDRRRERHSRRDRSRSRSRDLGAMIESAEKGITETVTVK
ncbi:hypothetical protein CC79DRAFT_1363061 [Sarocladium strictum]